MLPSSHHCKTLPVHVPSMVTVPQLSTGATQSYPSAERPQRLALSFVEQSIADTWSVSQKINRSPSQRPAQVSRPQSPGIASSQSPVEPFMTPGMQAQPPLPSGSEKGSVHITQPAMGWHVAPLS